MGPRQEPRFSHQNRVVVYGTPDDHPVFVRAPWVTAPSCGKTATATRAMVWCSLRRNAVSRTTKRQNGYRNPQRPRGVHARRTRLSHYDATKRLPRSPAIARCSRTENPSVASPSDRTLYCNPGDGVVLTSSKRGFPHHHAVKRLPQSPATARCSRTENPFVASPSARTPTAPHGDGVMFIRGKLDFPHHQATERLLHPMAMV